MNKHGNKILVFKNCHYQIYIDSSIEWQVNQSQKPSSNSHIRNTHEVGGFNEEYIIRKGVYSIYVKGKCIFSYWT